MITTSSASTATIIPFPARGTFAGQPDLFRGPSATPSSTTVVGLVIKRVHAPCRRCEAVHFIIGSSAAMHHARLTCAECGAFNGWMSKGEFEYVGMTVAKIGIKDF